MFIIFQIFFATCGNRQHLPFTVSHVNHVKVCQLASKISTSPRQISLQSKAFVWGKGKTFGRKVNLFNSVKDKSNIQVADKVTGNLTTYRGQAKDHRKQKTVKYRIP